MCTKEITINKGYQIIERKSTVDAHFAAKNILSTKKQFKYTSAEYKHATDTVEFSRHLLVCPHCGANMPAYIHFHDECRPQKRMRRIDADMWCGAIRSLFDNEDKFIELYKTLQPVFISNWNCIYCEGKASYSTETEQVTFEQNDNTLKVACNISSFMELVNIGWTLSLEAHTAPLIESVTFNFDTGRTKFELCTPEGTLVCSEDVTNGISIKCQTSKLCQLINDNIFVKKEITKAFNKIWKVKIPLTINEVDVNKFIFMCSFQSFPKEFYNCLPLNDDSSFDATFDEIKEQLHQSEKCVEILSKSSLPNIKSVKKVFFSNPAFFFYLYEAEQLWGIFKDPNLFCRFLDSKNAFANLHMMHMFPRIVDFYRDFAKIKTPAELFKLMVFFENKACTYGIYYSSLNKYQKALEQERWKTLVKSTARDYLCWRIGIDVESFFSREDKNQLSDEIQDQVCNGYTFTFFRSYNQFFVAAKELKNCLKSERFSNPIVGVMKNGHYIAALELYEDERWVIQAMLQNNECIEEDKQVFAAMKKWCAKNKLSYEPDKYDLFLPF